MEQYMVYSRAVLAYVDGGVLHEYSIDTDYLSNNASTIIALPLDMCCIICDSCD